MSGDPTVTCIICFLNEQRFLGEAVASVIEQTFGDWELLLVDDGSSDPSTEIAKSFAERDCARIRYLEHEGHRNRGLSASRNLGIDNARGRYVAFLDADDRWFPNKLAEQVAILDAHPQVAMVVGASKYWQSWAGEPEEADVMTPIGAPADQVIAPPALLTLLYPLGEGACPPPSDIMVRREILKAVGGFEASFRGPLMLYEDQAFLTKVYRGWPVYVASACWDLYRLRPESIVATTTAAGKYWRVRRHFLHWLDGHLKATGMRDAAVVGALDKAILRARVMAVVAPLKSRVARLSDWRASLGAVKALARRVLPERVYGWLKRRWTGAA
jgi:glycosyltransferase involved in cell wall biosynthesis